jgi:hypothetical protein
MAASTKAQVNLSPETNLLHRRAVLVQFCLPGKHTQLGKPNFSGLEPKTHNQTFTAVFIVHPKIWSNQAEEFALAVFLIGSSSGKVRAMFIANIIKPLFAEIAGKRHVRNEQQQ